MHANDAYGLGYQHVDDDLNVPFLVATMEMTSRWESIRELRTWERARLGLRAGGRLLDVGCGLGDAAVTLAVDVGATGEVVGTDSSGSMIAIARGRVPVAGPVRFCVGDALALDEPDGTFDAVRSERMLQWVADPAAAVREMARVLRPGGRISLIDTDWSTLSIDVGDDEVGAVVREALRIERNRPSLVGARLGALVRAAGFAHIAETSVRHHWTAWDPDASPAPDGCFSMESLADDIVDAGLLDRAGGDRFVATVREAARQDRFSMSLTMHAVVAVAPGPIEHA